MVFLLDQFWSLPTCWHFSTEVSCVAPSPRSTPLDPAITLSYRPSMFNIHRYAIAQNWNTLVCKNPMIGQINILKRFKQEPAVGDLQTQLPDNVTLKVLTRVCYCMVLPRQWCNGVDWIELCNDAHFSRLCQIKYNPHFADRAPGLQSRVFLCRHLGGRNRRGTACLSLE